MALTTNWRRPPLDTRRIRGIPDFFGDRCLIPRSRSRHRRTQVWKEKAKLYVQLAASGEFSREFKQPRFRVLVLAASRRLKFIREAVAEITQKIFWFAVLDDARGEQFFGPVWLRPTGIQHQSLFE